MIRNKLLAALAAYIFAVSPVYAAGYTVIQDDTIPSRTVKVNSDGSINVTVAGGGGPATIADCADVAEGCKADAANTSTVIGQLKQIQSNTSGPIPTQAPTVNIGATGISQTTPGTTNLVSLSGSASSTFKTLITCDKSAFYDASTNGKTVLVTGVSSQKIYICGIIIGTGGTATNVDIGSGTGAACVTTYTKIAPAWQLAANQRAGFNGEFWNGLVTLNNADHLCINTSAGNAVQALVLYTQQP